MYDVSLSTLLFALAADCFCSTEKRIKANKQMNFDPPTHKTILMLQFRLDDGPSHRIVWPMVGGPKNHPKTIEHDGAPNHCIQWFENHRKIAMVKFMILDYLIKIKGAFWVFPGRAPFWANFSPQEILKPIHCLWPSDIWVICTFCCSAIFCLFPQSYTIVAGGMEGGYSFQTPGANALRIFRPRLDRNFHSMSVFVGNCLNLEPI